MRKRRQRTHTHKHTHKKGGVTVDYWATALGYGNTSSVIRSAVLSPAPNSGLLQAQHRRKPGMHVFCSPSRSGPTTALADFRTDDYRAGP